MRKLDSDPIKKPGLNQGFNNNRTKRTKVKTIAAEITIRMTPSF